MSTGNQNLKVIVRGSYDVQKLRIQMGNRIVINFKSKLGQEPSQREEDGLDSEGKLLLKTLRSSYRKLTDGLKTFPTLRKFKGDEVISTYTELCLLKQYIELEGFEMDHFKKLGMILKSYPIYAHYLLKVKGVGPAMAGVIVSEIDIHKAKYPSCLWAYAGLDVAPDGKGRSRRAEHLVESEYTSKDGEVKTKKGITFNPFLKTKLVGVLGGSFLKAGENKYSEIYYNYKNRLEQHAVYKDVSKGHRHNMAVRYMVKQFLVDLHTVWREIEGLEVAIPYSEAKLGLKHGKPAREKRTIKSEKTKKDK